MLQTRVKAGSITNLTDARYFAAWGVEWLGFDLDQGSERYLPAHQVQAIAEWIDGSQIVGEFNLHSSEEISTAIELLSLDAIQAGPLTSTETIIALDARLPIIKEIVVEPNSSASQIEDQIHQFAPLAELFLINFEKNGISWTHIKEGKSLPLDFLRELGDLVSWLASMNFSPDQLNEMLDSLGPDGLHLVGGEEERVGLKSFDELDEVFEKLEVAG